MRIPALCTKVRTLSGVNRNANRRLRPACALVDSREAALLSVAWRRALSSRFAMPLPANKRELLHSFDAAFSKLVDELASVPSELERAPGIEGGLSPCDLVAYQIGWGRLLLSWDSLEIQGKPVEMPAPGYKWNQLGPLAGSFYREFDDQSLAQLLSRFEALAGELRRFIETSGERLLFGVGERRWAGAKWPVAKWIQVNTVAPYGSARAKLRKWKRSRAAPARD